MGGSFLDAGDRVLGRAMERGNFFENAKASQLFSFRVAVRLAIEF
jgi:hypothetical protein